MRQKELLKLLKENKHIFCHITSNLSKDNYFYPRIPEIARDDEDETIDRICVAKTLEGALTAIPNGAGRLDSYLEESSYYFKVFIIDTKKLGINKIMNSEELYKKDYVRDAEITGEHWILEPFEVPQEDIFYIRLSDWGESAADIIPYKIYELSETEEYNSDYERAYYDIYDDYIPFVCVIEDIDILVEDIKAGEKVEIDLGYPYSDLSKEELKERFLISNPDIEFIDEEDDNIIFLAKKDQNIREIMHIDWYYKHCV